MKWYNIIIYKYIFRTTPLQISPLVITIEDEQLQSGQKPVILKRKDVRLVAVNDRTQYLLLNHLRNNFKIDREKGEIEIEVEDLDD